MKYINSASETASLGTVKPPCQSICTSSAQLNNPAEKNMPSQGVRREKKLQRRKGREFQVNQEPLENDNILHRSQNDKGWKELPEFI